MATKPNYCKGVIIAHGRSEFLFAEHIKSNLHLNIEIYSERNGRSSIQIDSLMKIMRNNDFKSKTNLMKKYIIEEKNKKLVNFFVMPIMDLDDTTDDKIEKYKSGEMFNSHWLSEYIVPIWNDRKFDDVLYNLGLINKIPNDKEKGKIYREFFATNNGQPDIERVKWLLEQFESSNKTNMDVLINRCLRCLEKFN